MNVIRDLENIDWNFKRYRQYGIDNIHWFPANFIPQIPSILIANLSKEESVILDPFCGSGTTLVEAARLGRICIGVDNNPLACLITEVKVNYISLTRLINVSEEYEYLLAHHDRSLTKVPDFPNKNKWFHKKTLEELGNILCLINRENRKKIKKLLNMCFSAILKKCCSQRDHYTYVADNMFPKQSEALVYIDARKLFVSQLRNTIDALLNFYDDMRIKKVDGRNILSKCKVYEEDARLLKSINDVTIDLIVTSPPYVNVTDYTTGNRLSYYWHGLKDFNKSKEEEIGARWKRGRKNALDDYITDMWTCFKQFKRVLKKRGYLCLILGETSSIRKKINVIFKLIDILSNELNFVLLSKNIERNIYAKRIRASRGVNKEHIYIFRKGTKK